MKFAPRGHGCRALAGGLKHCEAVCLGSRFEAAGVARKEVPVANEGAVRLCIDVFDEVTGARCTSRRDCSIRCSP